MIWLITKKITAKAGLDSLSPRTLRHSFAMHLIAQGADLDSVHRILGNRNTRCPKYALSLAASRTRQEKA
ncbi:MAG: tyrosine-type recombinase/integrase [Gammaproteobacteria bacterium]